jgi:hypothetical protein
MFSLNLLDTIATADTEAARLLEELASELPPSAELAVQGGLPDERKLPLDFSPRPGPLREHLAPGVVERDLARLEAAQADDGGWTVDWQPASPAAELEWRGARTVLALRILRANERLA